MILALTLPLTAIACSEPTGEITRDSEPFSGIAESATITALGNEPFWGLTIEPEGETFAATYSTPENVEGDAIELNRFAGNNGLSFNGELDGESLTLALTPNDCSDTMSDRSYPYEATLLIGTATFFGCAYTSDQPFTGEEAL